MTTNTAFRRLSRTEIEAGVKRAVRRASDKDVCVRLSDTFAGTLEFDSLCMAALAIALEQEFQRPVALNEWYSPAPEPLRLDVASLCDFIEVQTSYRPSADRA